MIIPFVSSLILYGADDAYTEGDQYGVADVTSSQYGDDYGSGSYSDYSSERGQYSTDVEIVRYGSRSSSGSGYTVVGTEDGDDAATGTDQYGTTGTYRYGDGQDTPSSYGDVLLDYVQDVLDGDLELGYGSTVLYTPLEE